MASLTGYTIDDAVGQLAHHDEPAVRLGALNPSLMLQTCDVNRQYTCGLADV
jgi:hypothetical protein